MSAVLIGLTVRDTDPDAFKVVRFEGEERLTRPYRFDLDVVSSDAALPLQKMLGQAATLTLTRNDQTRHIHGIIAEASESGHAPAEAYAYRLALVPRISLLHLSQHNRTFATRKPMSVIDVVTEVLSDPSGTNLSRKDWSVRLLRPEVYPSRDFWTQYDESDFAFVHRLLEHWGIFYYFEQTETRERIVFSDANALSPSPTVDATIHYSDKGDYVPYMRGVAQAVSRRLRMVTRSAHLRDFNDQTPHLPVSAQAKVPNGHVGEYYEYAPHVLNEKEGSVIAQARAEEIGCEQDVFDIKSDSPFLTPGTTFSVAGHFRQALNQEYLPTVIRHSGIQTIAGAFWADPQRTEDGYHSVITAIPSSVPYRSPRQIRRPIMAGVMPATVEATEGDGNRAVLDAQGRYKVGIDFDSADNPAFERSTHIRMAQPYGGPAMGMHFPLREGTEVMVGWVDGDPDRPLIMGAVPNTQTASPVTSINQTENKIRTPSGISFIMNDGPGEEEQNSSTEVPPQHHARHHDSSRGSPGGAGNGSRRSSGNQGDQQASGQSTATGGVYTAFKVPATNSNLPHYMRLGDVAPADGYEPSIVTDSSFQGGDATGRSTSLSSGAYGGMFTYTPQNYTLTVDGDSNTVINGNHQVWIGGNSTTVIAGKSHATGRISVNTSIVGADSSEGASLLSADGSSDWYISEAYFLPKIEYFNTEKMEVLNGLKLEYTWGMSLASVQNFAGTFEHRLGAQVTLSGLPYSFSSAFTPTAPLGALDVFAGTSRPFGSSYNLSTSGYSYKQISGVDENHRIFGAKSVAIGCRPVTGTTAMGLLTEAANIATVVSTLSAVVADSTQAFTYAAAEGLSFQGEPAVYNAIQGAAAIGLGASYLTALAAILTYHLVTAPGMAVHDGISVVDPTASSLTMTPAAAALQYGIPYVGSIISLSPTGTTMMTGPLTQILIQSDVVTIFAPTVRLMANTALTIDAPSVTITSPAVSISGSLAVGGTIVTNSTMQAVMGTSAATGNFSA